jgi:hypothetical protein
MRLELKLLKRSEREKINNSNEVGSVRLCAFVLMPRSVSSLAESLIRENNTVA